MSKFFAEFRKFAVKGNAIDLAVGVVVGGAFGKIITSLVNDIVMPPLGLLVGNLDFSKLTVVLAIGKDGQPVLLRYGAFINNILDFTIVSFAIFLIVRLINRMKAEPVPPPPSMRQCPLCLSEIPLKATKCAHCASTLTPA